MVQLGLISLDSGMIKLNIEKEEIEEIEIITQVKWNDLKSSDMKNCLAVNLAWVVPCMIALPYLPILVGVIIG